MESACSRKTINLEVEKYRYHKNSKRNYFQFILFNIDRQTLIFDFDETIAKVLFNKKELPFYDEQVDILTKDKTITVIAHFISHDSHHLCRFI